MYAKNIVFLAVASLAADAVAVNIHRHGHEHLHKKDLKYDTEYETVTEWVTVTAYDPPMSTSSSAATFVVASNSKDHTRTRKFSQVSSSSSTTSVPEPTSASSEAEVAPTTSVVEAPSTTLATLIKPTTEAEKVPTSVETPEAAPTTTEVAAAPTTTEAAAEPTPTKAAPAAGAPALTGGKKRGLAYNDPNLLSGFVGDNSKVSWAYSWSQVNDLKVNLEFVPMLWGPADDHVSTWQSNANKAIAGGSSALLSFNEPDNAGQSNIDPATAAAEHIKHMNPFAGKARISTPAITNSGADGQGISWLKSFIQACNSECALDFAAVHWYSNNGDDFLSHLERVYEAVKMPIWVTEFAPVGNEVDYNDFLAKVVHELDTNPKYNFVERYSYFMVSDGRLVSGTQPSKLGNTFAYSS